MPSPQQVVDDLAEGLAVRFAILDNRADENGVDGARLGAGGGMCFTAEIRLMSAGRRLPGTGWQIHLSCLRRILAATDPRFTVEHVTGDHYVLRPTDAFPGWGPWQTVSIGIIGEGRILQISEVPPRWYVTAEGADARTLRSTDSEDAATYVLECPVGEGRMAAFDRTTAMTAAARHARNAEVPADLAVPDPRRPVPAALRVDACAGALPLSAGLRLAAPDLAEERRAALVAALDDVGLAPRAGAPVLSGRIDPAGLPAEAARPGGYRLDVGPTGVWACGFDADGLCHAVRSLISLVGPDRQAVPAARIVDAPRYAHRGLLLDVARNVLDAEAIMTILEQMAALRLNVLHLHLADDEGWRLAIPGLPELTEVGARRGHDPGESAMLGPQLGSGPRPDTSGSGWLTPRDYIAILRHAAARGVEVVPEIDMPGHSRAAVVAMEARYQRLRAAGVPEQVAARHRLVDPQDETTITTVQHYDRRATLNPGLPGTFAFVEHVVAAVAQMHRAAGVPLRTWHLGGDEVRNMLQGWDYTDLADPAPGRGVVDQAAQDRPWGRSPAAAALVADGTVGSLAELTGWFALQVDAIVRRHGVQRVLIWHEGVEHIARADLFGGPVTVLAWTSTAWGLAEEVAALRRKGFEVICCAPDFLYFDFPYEAHPLERGVSWATRAIDGRKVFSLAPDNLAQVAEVAVNRFGEHFEVVAEPDASPVAGIQGHLWSENVRGARQVQAMIFPRTIAVAERAWHRAAWEQDPAPGVRYAGGRTALVDARALLADWAQFAATVTERVLPRLDRAGIAYRVPGPGVRVVPGGIEVTCSSPGLPAQVSVDGGRTWSEVLGGRASVAGEVHVRVLSADRRRSSRVEVVTVPATAGSGAAGSGAATAEPATSVAATADPAAPPPPGRPPEPARPGGRPPG